MEKIEFDTLYKRDSNGKVRTWRMEVEHNGEVGKFRTVAGILDGKQVTSKWTVAEAKNVGKVNETTSPSQAIAEVQAEYRKKLEREYFENVEDIDSCDIVFPQLATKYSDLAKKGKLDSILKGGDAYFQPKLDGFRCIAKKDGLWSRDGVEYISCPHIMAALQPVFEEFPDMIFDGELYNHDYRDDFETLSGYIRTQKADKLSDPEVKEKIESTVQYHVYDIVDTNALFHDRFTKAMEMVDKINNYYIVPVQTTKITSIDHIDELFENVMDLGYEGGIVRKNAKYEIGKRSKNLIKRVDTFSDEFDVIEVLEGKGNWSGAAKHLVIQLKDGETCKTSVKGTYESLKKLFESDKPDWATVLYRGFTKDGKLRFGVAKDWGYGLRED